MEKQPLPDDGKVNKKRGLIYLGSALGALAILLGSGDDIKRISGNALFAARSYVAGDYHPQRVTMECSEPTEAIRVKPGENQWLIEQREIKGASSVTTDVYGTATQEQHPGDGILEPGDTVIIPAECWREYALQK